MPNPERVPTTIYANEGPGNAGGGGGGGDGNGNGGNGSGCGGGGGGSDGGSGGADESWKTTNLSTVPEIFHKPIREALKEIHEYATRQSRSWNQYTQTISSAIRLFLGRPLKKNGMTQKRKLFLYSWITYCPTLLKFESSSRIRLCADDIEKRGRKAGAAAGNRQ